MCHLAAKNGHSLCLGLLVYYGANLQTKTLHGWEPIHLAAYHGHLGTSDWKNQLQRNQYNSSSIFAKADEKIILLKNFNPEKTVLLYYWKRRLKLIQPIIMGKRPLWCQLEKTTFHALKNFSDGMQTLSLKVWKNKKHLILLKAAKWIKLWWYKKTLESR